MVSGIMGGQAMDQSLMQWVKRVTHGNQTTVYAGPNVMMSVEFASDSSKTPKAIDYVNTAGAHKGKRQQGIYEFEGNRLTVCVAPPGIERPKQFQSTRSNGNTLTVWERL